MDWRAALARARTLASALDRDGALAQALVLARDRNLNFDLASALLVARTLVSALDLDRARVLDGARIHAGELVRDLTRACDSAFETHRERALNDAAVSAQALAGDLDLALRSVLACDDVPGRAATSGLDPSSDLASALTSALASYHDLLRALASYPVLDRDRDLAADFARYRAVAQDLVCCLNLRPAAPAPPDPVDARRMPGGLWLAVLLQPRSWQPRYREELLAELGHLSSGKERRAFARRVLARSLQLRRARAGTECPPDHARVEG